ncbi:MAG: hydroxysqualene dehydroxylase HpnE [Isosphaeraceae bacterium]
MGGQDEEDPAGAPRLIIVGGGLAGLATAVALADRGLAITILESRPRLGGRASSFNDPSTGEPVDNCQHVSMGCCTNLNDFCRRVGTADLFRPVEEMVFLDPEGRISRLKAGPLPAPLHLTGSFLAARYLGLGERIRVAYGMACLRWAPVDSNEPFESWLRRHGQTDRAIDRFWGTVLVSALNERLDRMDVGHARKVFLEGFLRNRDGYRMELPLAPLGELYGNRLEDWLAQHRMEVRLKAGVRSVDLKPDGRVCGVTLRDGRSLPADLVAMAVPFDRVRAVLGESTAARLPHWNDVEAIESSPITGIHFWFDRPVCPYEHVVTLGRTVQWVFNHTALQGREPEGGGQYLQLVVSAAYDLVGMDRRQIQEIALNDLAAIWPGVREAKLVRSWIVTEHGATFAVRPGIDRIRPPQRTEVPGLFLAGDWTATGWPATMEGAVRSGYLAAEGILQDLGRPDRLVRADLPGSWLSNFLLGSAG